MSSGNPLNSKASPQISEPLIGATKISIHHTISPSSVEDWGSKGSARTPHCSRSGAIPCRCLDWAPEASNKSAWRALSIANIVLFIIVIGVNGLLGATDVLKSAGGFSIGEQSNRHKTAITPASYAFSIWSVIYTLNGFYMVAQALHRPTLAASIVPNLWLGVGNIAWVFAWALNQLALSCVFMVVGILAPLIVMYHTIGEAAAVRASTPLGALSTRVWVSMYLGWISVATIVNFAGAATPVDGVAHGGWSASNWSITMLTVATLLGFLMLALHADAVYAGVLVWAFIAIARNQGDASEFPGDDRVVKAASVYAVCLSVGIAGALTARCQWRK